MKIKIEIENGNPSIIVIPETNGEKQMLSVFDSDDDTKTSFFKTKISYDQAHKIYRKVTEIRLERTN